MARVESKLRHEIAPMPDADPLLGSVASEVVRYLASVAMTAVATAVAVGVDSKVTIPNLSLVFVVPVIIAGVGLGLGPSLCAAILGALAFNFFLTEPRYTLVVDDPANVWAIGLLFVVGLIVSGVAFTSRQRATEAALLRRQASVLQGYSRDLRRGRQYEGDPLDHFPSSCSALPGSCRRDARYGGQSGFPRESRRRRAPRGRIGGGALVLGDWNCRARWHLPGFGARALTFGPWRRPKARMPSLGSLSIRTNVLRRQMR